MCEARRSRIDGLGYDYAAQPKQEATRCNLCGQQRFVVLTHRDRYGFPAQAHGCLQCGLVFLNPVMTAQSYQNFYASVYRPLVSAYHGRLIDAKTIQAEQRVYAVERADWFTDYVRPGVKNTLLDIGGSTGVVAHYFAQRFGLRATILDPSPLEIEEAQQLGLETITGFWEDFDPADRSFDLVIMCQTVDHLLDIAGAVHKVRRVLGRNGLFFIDIVDLRAAYLRNWSVEEAIKIDHPFYLTEAAMTAYLLRGGFEILRIIYAADHLHIGYICQAADPQPGYLPAKRAVENLWQEIRMVQNTQRR